jgi:hypothetical protein
MSISRPRKALIGAALGIISLWLSAQLFGVGIATAIPRLNFTIAMAAMALLTFECGLRFGASKRPVNRVTAGIGALIFGSATLLAGFSILVCIPETILGEMPVRHGRLVAYQSSFPLVSDSVLVQVETQILPGLYAFQTKALLDPAWSANVRVETNLLLVSYADGSGLRHHLEVSP